MTVSHRVTFKTLLLAATMLASPLIVTAPIPAAAQIAITLSVPTAPPLLPIYAQPAMPQSGYIWTPGYWHWGHRSGYYWVPGTWVLPPMAGMLWTPPYWAWGDGAYVFHAGYWGPNVGYYGGVNYGYGYGGVGYEGGRWEGRTFVYNRTVNNFGGVHVAHVYAHAVAVNNNNTRASFVGGVGGLANEPTAQDRSAEHDRHAPVTAVQTRHVAAAANTGLLAASRNHGVPAIAATSRPAQFKGPGVVRAQPASAGEHAAARPAGAAPDRTVVRQPIQQSAAAPRPAPPHPPEGERGRDDKGER